MGGHRTTQSQVNYYMTHEYVITITHTHTHTNLIPSSRGFPDRCYNMKAEAR